MNCDYNQAIIDVVLNHKDQKKIKNINFNVYTLTDKLSGNNFDVWSVSKIDFIENMKLLTELKTIKFNVIVDTNKIKLRPVELIK